MQQDWYESVVICNYVCWLSPDTCQYSKKIWNPGSPGSKILDRRILDSMFSFYCGILGILDPVAAALSWDPRDLVFQIEKISLDPVDPGSY